MRFGFIAIPVVASLALSQMVLAQCAPFAPLQNLSGIPNRFNVDGNLAIDSAGKVHAIFQSFQSPNGENYYVTNQSGSFSAPQPLGSMSDKGSVPKIVITPDNQLHAFFGRNNLFWRTKPVSGGAWSAAVEVAINPTGSNFIQAVTVDSTGGIYLMWGHLFDNAAPARNGIYGRYKPLGGGWQSTELIYGNGDDSNWPRGTDVMARGTTIWVGIELDDNVYYKKKSSSGTWPGGKGTVLQSGSGALTFAYSPVTAEFVGLYQKNIGCGADPCESAPWFEVFARSTFDDGASWSAPASVSNNLDDIDRAPSGVFDGNGNLHAVWEGFCCDHKLRMRYRGRIGGTWDPSVTQITDDTGGHIPHSLQAQGTSLFMVFSDSQTNVGLYDVMFTSSVASQPRIGLGPTTLNHTIFSHASVPNDTINISNGCLGTLNYTISDNAAWLDASPASGSSTGETDPITISYPGAAALSAGIYNAIITVSGNAINTPQTVSVQLKVQTVTPDFDGDGDVDQVDFAHLQKCLTGPNNPTSDPNCDDSQLDGDLDVDGADVDAFLACFSGPDVTANMSCAALYP